MESEGKIDLTEKVNAMQERFKALQEEAKKLVEQRTILDRRLTEIRDEQLKLQGAYDFVVSMANESKTNGKEMEQPKLVIPSKKKGKEKESEEVVDG